VQAILPRNLRSLIRAFFWEIGPCPTRGSNGEILELPQAGKIAFSSNLSSSQGSDKRSCETGE